MITTFTRGFRVRLAGAGLMLCMSLMANSALAQTLYVSNASTNNVTVIRPKGAGVIATIPVGQNPQSIAVSPDGRRAYTANANSSTISVIDTASKQVIATYNTAARPYNLIVSPDGATLYVAAYDAKRIQAINASTGTAYHQITLLNVSPIGLTLNKNGDKLFVGDYNSGDITVINTTDFSVYNTITLSGYSYPGSATDNNDQVLLPHGDKVALYSISSQTFSNLDSGNTIHGLAYNAATDRYATANYASSSLTISSPTTPGSPVTANLPGKPSAVVFNTDGSRVYAPDYGTHGSTSPGTVSSFNPATGTFIENFVVGGNPSGIAYHSSSPDVVTIPTLTEWAMILLGLVLAGFAVLTLQRRQQTA